MAQVVRDVMTSNPASCSTDASAAEAATKMRDNDTGAILVVDGQGLRGIVTDRDIVVRSVAEGRSPADTKVGEICSSDVQALEPDQSVDEAVKLMRENAIRRIPVVEDGTPVGIVSIGDLAIERDAQSALADISAAPGNQ
jgi:CBS domain-containing protein